MFFRFGVALVLVVLISLAGTALEKRNLELRRVVSRQSYQLEILQEQHAAKRVLAQQLGAPSRLVDQLDAEAANSEKPAQPVKPGRSRDRKPRHNSHAARRGSL
jgi:hypothetical protein